MLTFNPVTSNQIFKYNRTSFIQTKLGVEYSPQVRGVAGLNHQARSNPFCPVKIPDLVTIGHWDFD